MQNAILSVKRFLVSEDGPTAVEYAVMLALILVACITIVTTLGQSVSSTFSKVNNSMGTAPEVVPTVDIEVRGHSRRQGQRRSTMHAGGAVGGSCGPAHSSFLVTANPRLAASV